MGGMSYAAKLRQHAAEAFEQVRLLESDVRDREGNLARLPVAGAAADAERARLAIDMTRLGVATRTAVAATQAVADHERMAALVNTAAALGRAATEFEEE
jgi:hypothetical protein